MKKYEPLFYGEKDEWLKLEDEERIALVLDYHENHDEEFEGESIRLHAAMHVVVENQIALGEAYVEKTVARIMRQGVSAHEAIHAIAAILSEDIVSLLNSGEKEFSTKKYRRKLEKLTAKRWRKGQF